MNYGADEGAIDTIRRVCGDGVADRLLQHFAGRVIHIPQRPPKRGPLTQHFGPLALEALCQAVGGEKVEVPIGMNGILGQLRTQIRTRVRDLTLAGRSASDTAAEVGCALRTVFNVRAEMRRTGEIRVVRITDQEASE